MKLSKNWFKDWLVRQNHIILTLEWIMVLLTFYVLVMAGRDIVGPAALLFESLDNLFRSIVKVVDEQYVKSSVNFDDDESMHLFKLLRGPMPTLIFLHLLITVFNASCLLSGLICRANYFTKFNIVFMGLLLIMDAGVFLTLIYVNHRTHLTKFVQELQTVQTKYSGAETDNFPTLLFNYIHQHLNCCGIHSYTEWFNSTINWKREVTYNNVTYKIVLPISCCPNLTIGHLPDCAQLNTSHQPFTQGCGELLLQHTLFSTTNIPERLYTLLYFVAHVLTICVYVIKKDLTEQKGKNLFLYHEGGFCESEKPINGITTITFNTDNKAEMDPFAPTGISAYTNEHMQPHKSDSAFY